MSLQQEITSTTAESQATGAPLQRKTSKRGVNNYIEKISNYLLSLEEKRAKEDAQAVEKWKKLAEKYGPELEKEDLPSEDESETEDDYPDSEEETPASSEQPRSILANPLGLPSSPTVNAAKKQAAVKFTAAVLKQDKQKEALNAALEQHDIPLQANQRNPWEEHVRQLLQAKIAYEAEKQAKAEQAEKSKSLPKPEQLEAQNEWQKHVDATVSYARQQRLAEEQKRLEKEAKKRAKKDEKKMVKEKRQLLANDEWNDHVVATLAYVRQQREREQQEKEEKEEYGQLETGLEKFMAKLGIRPRSRSRSRSVSPHPQTIPHRSSVGAVTISEPLPQRPRSASTADLLSQLQEQRDAALAKAAFYESKYRALLAELGRTE